MQGRIDTLGSNASVNLHEEMNIIVRMLRLKPGVRDVCCEVEFGGLTLAEKVQERKQTRH